MLSAIAPADQQLTTLVYQQVRKYPSDEQQLARFLEDFPAGSSEKKYLKQLQQISDLQCDYLRIHLDDLEQYAQNFGPDDPKFDATLPSRLVLNVPRYLLLAYAAAEATRLAHCPANPQDEVAAVSLHRGQGRQESMLNAGVPVHLRVPYDVRFVAASATPALAIRDVGAAAVGNLVKVEGIVAKISTVKPRLAVAYYRCSSCNTEVHQAIEEPSFMPSTLCQSATCRQRSQRGTLRLVTAESKFVKCQSIRIQEPPGKVPTGSVPRSQRLLLEGSLTRQLLPGQTVKLSGVLVPVAKSGFAAMRAGLVAETQFVVHDAEVEKAVVGVDGLPASVSDAQLWRRQMEDLKEDPELYDRLASSLAPGIHGMEDVKKVLLLQLVGGVTQTFPDGMKIRGDIHVLLMGDPGVAKSQMLGQVCQLSPRAHFTTGKGSSGVGLTASVVRDAVTGDLALEGGAIVLSDRGICCIDEFDKMDEYDRTAIHEVMEQQTVSISKAGLTTTLNARTAILAAANPQYGRYDVRKTPLQNINLPAALLSRFDVQFLLLDRADRSADVELARHVLRVHQKSAASSSTPADNSNYIPGDMIRSLVAQCKKYRPRLPPALVADVRDIYVEQRAKEREQHTTGGPSTAAESLAALSYTTPRALLAVLRLSQALARLRMSDEIGHGDLEEARRLLAASRRSVEEELQAAGGRRRQQDGPSAILDLLKQFHSRAAAAASAGNTESAAVPWKDFTNRAAQQGFTDAQMEEFLQMYEELEVIQADRTASGAPQFVRFL